MMQLTMKEAIVDAETNVVIKESQIPDPSADQVLIRVEVFGTNPKDWKVPAWTNTPHNSGDDVAGVVESVGTNVVEFKKGDRVAGLHVPRTGGGAFGEYALVPSNVTFHIPPTTTYEEVSTSYITSGYIRSHSITHSGRQQLSLWPLSRLHSHCSTI